MPKSGEGSSTKKENTYYRPYWADDRIKFAIAIDGVVGDFSGISNLMKVSGTYGNFYYHSEDLHPTQYRLRVSANSPVAVSLEEKEYWGSIEYYVSKYEPTLKEVLKGGILLEGPDETLPTPHRYYAKGPHSVKKMVEACKIRVQFIPMYETGRDLQRRRILKACYSIVPVNENVVLYIEIPVGHPYNNIHE